MAGTRFQSFVIFAAMRTGSNFLEQSLNTVPGIVCHGEAFNPVFVGYPNRDALFGMSMAERDARPKMLLEHIRAAPDLNGFRYFPDHDPRVFDEILADARCAKVILTRNPVESYVSLKIARQTGQWKLNDVRRLKSTKISFDPVEFLAHLEQAQEFQLRILHGLQVAGQTAFYIDYDDIGDTAVLTGVCRYLGVEAAEVTPAKSLIPQNPEALADKVTNPAEMTAALAGLDRFNLSRTPNFEPRRGAAVPGFVAAKGAPLLFMPVRSGPTSQVEAWLARLGSSDQQGLTTGFSQASLRDWMRDHVAHRSFTVLRHPVARAYSAFSEMVLSAENPELNEQLARQYKIGPLGAAHADPPAHRAAFKQFLRFLKANLNGQTNARVDPAWASQTALVTGFSRAAPPDVVIREDDLANGLAQLCATLGVQFVPLGKKTALLDAALVAIYDPDIEALTRAAYQRDYLTFGFGPWSGNLIQ